MQEIRLRFSKTDQAKYISHLDTNRVFSRAFARAKIPLWFTEGFNPHPFMSFSLPLSLGVESLCENVDIRILENIPYDEIKRRMNESLPQGIRIVDKCAHCWDGSQEPQGAKSPAARPLRAPPTQMAKSHVGWLSPAVI